MSELLKSGKVGNIQVKQLQEQRIQVIDRWEQTGLLEGLSESKKSTIAQLMENEAGYLLSEASNELSNIAGFDIAAFPMVRRVFSRLLANDIVSVQPLSLPTGLLFYMDHQVSTDTDRIIDGSSTWQSVYDAHYANAGYANAKGAPTSNSEALVATATTGVMTLPYSGGEEGLSSLQVFDNIGAEVQFAINPQSWTDDFFASNEISVTVPNISTGSTVIGASARTVWDSYADLEANSAMTEVKLVVTSTTVQVTSRKMKAHWTPELAQDLAAYHSVDAEAELTGLLSEELAAEIDREIIRDLIAAAAFQDMWVYDRSSGASVRVDGTTITADPASGYVTQKEWNQTLITKINKVSAAIHKATLRGGANWIVCSTEIGSVLEDIEKFHAANAADDLQFNMGIEQIGTLGSRYTVYKDPYLPASVCLLGHKGSSFMDTGYVYAPYIPFQLTPVVLDPADFTPRKGIMTRYAKKVVNNRYFGLVTVVFPTDYTVVHGGTSYIP